jgi:hypothetical protein
MAFTDNQLRRLRAPVQRKHIKEREVDGKTLHYLEGWHVVAEANRLFGFDGWDRETISSQCVWQKQIDSRFAAAYLVKVRISVRAGEAVIVREGQGSAEAIAATPGQAHERACKAAETDATKRALSTFGNSFGLSLYRDKTEPTRPRAVKAAARSNAASGDKVQRGGNGDISLNIVSDTHGGADQAAQPVEVVERPTALLPVYLPPVRQVGGKPVSVNKNALVFGEPKRLRDRDHLRYVAKQACLACGRQPSQAHHLRFSQPRALGRKVSDEFTVPLCAVHHHELHARGNEVAWWAEKNIEPLAHAAGLWQQSRHGTSD